MKNLSPDRQNAPLSETQSGRQTQTPLLSRLLDYSTRATAAFHTPGHHGRGVAEALRSRWGEAVFAADLPELPGLDNLFAPADIIAEAQTLAAEAFGSDRTFFLINGSTAGILAAILATCGPGDALLLPRTVHRSVISGLILSGAQPIFLLPEICPRTGLVGTVTPEAIAQALAHHPDIKAVLMVSPTYEGVCAEIGAIAALCHDHHIPLLVDEAHGPHFGFHPGLPASALSQGADLVVQSTHKVLSGLTQSAMLHYRQYFKQQDGQDDGASEPDSTPLISLDRVAQALALVQSSSPSYLLLASLDAARSQMATQGHALMTQTLALAEQARDRLRPIPGITVFDLPSPQPGFAQLDRTRLTVDVSALGLTGFEADEILSAQGVIAELPALRHLSFIVSLGNRAADIDRLVKAIAELSIARSAEISVNTTPERTAAAAALNWEPGAFSDLFTQAMAISPARLPREAYFAVSRAIALEEASGHISAETICPYPPGIPVLLPGEQIGAGAVAYLLRVQAAGGLNSGASDPTLQTIRVILAGDAEPVIRGEPIWQTKLNPCARDR